MRMLGLREEKGIRGQNKDLNPGIYLLSTTLLSPTCMEVSCCLLSSWLLLPPESLGPVVAVTAGV